MKIFQNQNLFYKSSQNFWIRIRNWKEFSDQQLLTRLKMETEIEIHIVIDRLEVVQLLEMLYQVGCRQDEADWAWVKMKKEIMVI